MFLLSLARVALQVLALLIATAVTPASPIASRLLHQAPRSVPGNQTVVLPARSRLQLRLTTALSSATSRPGDRVSAVLTVDVAASGLVVPAGTIVRGVVRQAAAFSWSAPQALLWLDFREVLSFRERSDEAGRSIPIVTRLLAVDNARETVDQDGRILGITPPREAPSSAEGAVLLAALVPEFYDLARAEFSLRELERPDIVYGAGTDVVLETLTATPDVPARAADAEAMPDRELLAIAAAQPLRTVAGTPPRPADVINLVLGASEADLRQAFETAGWNTAVALGLRADVKTILAVAVDRGYKLGPVSLQSLNGRSPDHVFQKQTNTFDRRHHIRIWRVEETYQSQPVWAASATHDIGIKFAREERTFTHRVEQPIDLERQKVVDDLRFAGSVAGYALESRPGVPTQLTNATGDVMATDGKVAVVVLRPR